MAILVRSNEPASHWYDAQGRAVHTVPAARGGDRATTIRDAIRLRLLPSVTNILGVLAKPQLETWKLNQVAKAALANPKQPGESDEYWIKRVVEASKEPVIDAADLGSKIHEALEHATAGELFDESLRVYVEPVLRWIGENDIRITDREIVLVNAREGYAGRCDALYRFESDGIGVLDFKTRKTEAGKSVTAYDGQGAQLAAYAACSYPLADLPRCRLTNIYISTTEPGRIAVVDHADPAGEYDFFLHAAAAWRKIKQYDPRQLENGQ